MGNTGENHMMRNRVHVLLAAWLVSAATVLAQGSLTPPGAPAPTMKTLSQIEPRTPISSAGYQITNSGSYYLTTNLFATGHGISIYASSVDVDLMGFTIAGEAEPGYQGIYMGGVTNAPLFGVTIHNGVIRNFAEGIRAGYCRNGRFERLILTSHVLHGIHFFGQDSVGCSGNRVAECTFVDCGDSGLLFNGSRSGRCVANVVQDCTIIRCGSKGVSIDATEGGFCADNRILDCVISSNGLQGIRLEASQQGTCRDAVIDNCVLNGNGSYGLDLFSSTTGRCIGVTLADCAITTNGRYGIRFYAQTGGGCDNNRIYHCTIHQNGSRGISLDNSSGNRIDQNHMTLQFATALNASAAYSNLFFQNTAVGNSSGNYDIHAANTRGPTVTDRGGLSALTGSNSLSPWANFSR